MDDVSQVPVTAKEKSDLSFEISGSFQTGYDYHSDQYFDYKHIIFQTKGNNLMNSKIFYALRDDLSVGLNYQLLNRGKANHTNGHVVGPAINYFKNFDTKRNKAIYGFDILGSVQYRTSNNEINVREAYEDWSVFPFFFPYSVVVEGDTLSSIHLNQQLVKFIIQPSFSVEMKNFHLFLGASFTYQNQFKYKSPQLNPTETQLAEVEFEEPFGYYNRKKSAIAAHIFYGFGVGPDLARLNLKLTHVTTSDPFNEYYFTLNLGLSSNLNIKKLANQRRTKGIEKFKDFGPQF